MLPIRSIGVLGLALLSALQLVSVVALVERSEAEHSGPLVMNTVDSALAHYRPQTHVSGRFRVQGSEAMYPLLTRLSLEFQRRQPKVVIDVRGGGSGKAIAEFLQPPLNKVGKVMWPEDRAVSFKMVASSRELFDNELNEFVAQHGHEPTVVPVAVDAVALYVHKDNPLAGLTIDQADAIFSTTRNRGYSAAITRWGQLGVDNEWEQAPIQLYGRDHKSGTRAFFQEHVLAGGEFRVGSHDNPGAASVILDVSRDYFGIGYSGLGLHASFVRVVPLAEAPGMPFVTPSSTTVADQTYPLRRVLYLYMNKLPQSPLPAAAQEFLAFILSYEGQEAVVKAGFFPLPLDRATKSPIALELSRAATTVR